MNNLIIHDRLPDTTFYQYHLYINYYTINILKKIALI